MMFCSGKHMGDNDTFGLKIAVSSTWLEQVLPQYMTKKLFTISFPAIDGFNI